MGPFSRPATVLVTSAVTGVVSHLSFFKKADLDAHPIAVINGIFSSLLAILILAGIKTACLFAIGYFTSLYASILVYRAFFHPLHHFPGPRLAKLTKLWTACKAWQTGFHINTVYENLRDEYGDFVRTAPREIMIFDAAMIGPVLSSGAKVRKGPMYSAGERSLHMTRDKAFQRRHKKIWEMAMKESLSDFAPRVEEFTSQLLARIESSGGMPVLLNELFMFYSYDVMSAFAFGTEIGFTKGEASEESKLAIQSITENIAAMSIFLLLPWLLNVIMPFAAYIKELRNYNEWTKEQLLKRQNMKNHKPDVMTHLIANASPDPQGQEILFADARLIIGAGSDTAATTLTLIFAHLAAYPKYTQLLLDEIARVGTSFSCRYPQPVLDGIINETLRLFPLVTVNAPREAPPEGLTINGTYIPGGTVILAPLHAFAHDEKNFSRANEFLPERWWTESPEMVMNKSAWLPFLTGPYTCAGKALAYMELRSVVWRVVSRYEVLLPEGFEIGQYSKDVVDHAVITAPKILVKFEERK